MSPSITLGHGTKLYAKDADKTLDWDPKMAPKLDFDEDYYKVLEVDSKCDEKQLKKGYYKMVSKYHPDGKHTPEEKDLANKQMMVINGAYRILKESDLRIMYDAQRSQGLYGARAGVKSGKDGVSTSPPPKNTAASKPRPGSPPPRPSSSTSSSAGRTYSSEYFRDMFNDLFGRGDPDVNAAEHAQRERLKEAQEAYSRRIEEYEANFRRKAREKLRSNVDAALDRLISQYWSVAVQKDELESRLLRDRRDWGAANLDPRDVQKRLKDLEEYRFLAKQVLSLEQEVAARVYPNPVHAYLNRYKKDFTNSNRGSSSNRQRNRPYSWSGGDAEYEEGDEFDVDDNYSRPPPPPPSRRSYSNDGSPQAQPQRQRANPSSAPRKTQTYEGGSGGGGGYQTWQDEQRRRRQGYKGSDDDDSTSAYRPSPYGDEDDVFDWFSDRDEDISRQRKSPRKSQSSQVYESQAKEIIRDFSTYDKKWSTLLTDNEVIEDVAALLKASDESRNFANAAERIDPYNLTDDDDFFADENDDGDMGDFNFEKELASAILRLLAARLRDRN